MYPDCFPSIDLWKTFIKQISISSQQFGDAAGPFSPFCLMSFKNMWNRSTDGRSFALIAGHKSPAHLQIAEAGWLKVNAVGVKNEMDLRIYQGCGAITKPGNHSELPTSCSVNTAMQTISVFNPMYSDTDLHK